MIFVFSGTGNSLHTARSLADKLSDRLVAIGPHSASQSHLLGRDERVVWVCPVHSWGLPAPVKAAMKGMSLNCTPANRHYLVATCGDDAGLTERQWRRLAARRGWATAGAWTVTMPNSYVAMPGFDVDPEPLALDKLQKAGPRIAAIARAIAAGSSQSDCTEGRWAWVKTAVIHPWFMARKISARPFSADASACNGCGACAKACPMHNIAMADGLPRWGSDCAGCLGCLHTCPAKAIERGSATRGKGRYTYPRMARKLHKHTRHP